MKTTKNQSKGQENQPKSQESTNPNQGVPTPQPATVNDWLLGQMKSNPAGGEFTLEQMEENMKGMNVTRRDIIHALKNSNVGMFIAGRKGHKSRWLYGPRAEEMAERARASKKASDDDRNESNPGSEVFSQVIRSFALQVTVAGQMTQIPVKIELVPA